NRGMPLSVLFASSAQRDALVQSHIVAHNRGLADDYTHAVVDKESAANSCSRMNLDAGQPAGHLGEKPAKKEETVIPQGMIDAIKPDRMQAGVAEEYFSAGLRCRIPLHDCVDVLPN